MTSLVVGIEMVTMVVSLSETFGKYTFDSAHDERVLCRKEKRKRKRKRKRRIERLECGLMMMMMMMMMLLQEICCLYMV